MTDWPRRLLRGFGYLTLDPSPRLRRLRGQQQPGRVAWPGVRLPPLPDSAYPPGAVPPDCSGIPGVTTCRHCGGEIIPCTVPSCFGGWKHVAYLHYGPIGPHYCGGRSVNPLAGPAGDERLT